MEIIAFQTLIVAQLLFWHGKKCRQVRARKLMNSEINVKNSAPLFSIYELHKKLAA